MSACFIWSDATGASRNCFVLFRQVVRLGEGAAAGILNLFVDNRYRLRVNGVVVMYGPIRFLPGFPEYDSIDLTPHLRSGDNVLVVEAWSPNANNFQAMRESRGGFIAWGDITSPQSISLETPGGWHCQQAQAWDEQAGAFSFAQGPVEICDLSRLPERLFTATTSAGWQPPTLIASRIWGPLSPRSLPLLGMACDTPSQLLLAARLDQREERLVGRSVAIAPRLQRGAHKVRFPYALCIHSPHAQEIEIGSFWGPNYLNGVDLVQRNDPLLGNRQNGTAALQAGWNLLYGEPEALGDVWGVLLGLPAGVGLTLRVAPRMDAAYGIAVGPAQLESQLTSARGALPTQCTDLARLPWSWTTMSDADMPAREVAWDRLGAVIARNQVAAALVLSGGAHVLIYDFGAEVLGHVQIDIEASAGTVVDCCLDERQRADGQLAIFATNPFADTVDRFRTSGGRQQLEGFHPRGGRYVQLTIRPPRGGDGRCTVHGLTLRNARVAVGGEGAFACSDPVLSWAWASGLQTLQACVEDAFLDCPWRERGTYLGDALVETHALRSSTRNLAVAWRTATLAAQSQTADGQIMGCVPSWMTGPGGDFTLIWVLMVHDLWAASGDLSRLTALWPTVESILGSSHWNVDASGLWSATGANLFIDWGIHPDGRSGDANAVLNALRIRALQCAAAMAGALSLDGARYVQQAATVTATYRRVLWLEDQGRFASHVSAGAPATALSAIHANVLALAFGIASPTQEAAIMHFLVPALQANVERALGTHPEYLELYYLHYALQALYRLERSSLAEAVMRSHYLPLKNAGAWTLWEGLRSGIQGQGSLCHAWSAAAMWAATDHILGVRYEQPGQPESLLIAPDSLLTWASGSVPHPRGVVHVRWRREGEVVWLDAEVPAGVQARLLLGPALRNCRLIARVHRTQASAAGA